MTRDCRGWGAGRVGGLAALLGALAVAGCGGGKTAQVSGKVTYAGEPLNSGTVSFVGPEGSADTAMLQPDGTYNLTKAPIGQVKIGVQTFPPSPMMAPPDPAAQKGKKTLPKYTKIPTKYGDPEKSGQTYTVQPGSQTYDINLPK